MDVSRGDRVIWEGDKCEVIVAEPDGLNEVVLKRERDDCYYTADLDELSPAPPDVVTLTLRYKGHEVSVDAEAESIPAWKDFGGGSLTQLCAAARVLAEKVDGEVVQDGTGRA